MTPASWRLVWFCVAPTFSIRIGDAADPVVSKCLCAVKFTPGPSNVISMEPRPALRSYFPPSLGAAGLREHARRVRLYETRFRNNMQKCTICKGYEWRGSFCGPVPHCLGSNDGISCFVKQSIQSRPVCVNESELSLATEVRGFANQKLESWHGYFATEAGDESLESFVAHRLERERLSEVPFAEPSDVRARLCHAPGVYRSPACDNQTDFQAILMEHERIPVGRGVCLDRQCYDLLDVIELTKRDLTRRITIPHSRRYTEEHELDSILPRLSKTIILEECDGCVPGETEFLPRILEFFQGPRPCENFESIVKFRSDEIWEGAKEKLCSTLY